MDSSHPQQGMSKQTAWIVLIVVVLALAIGAYFLLKQDGTNTNNSNITNQVVNTNTSANANVTVNTNTNITAHLNTNIDTSNWKTYTNSEYGYTVKYPSDWQYEDINLTVDPLNSFPTPIRYSIFYSPEKKFHLVIGIKKSGEVGSIYYRTGVSAGEIVAGSDATIGDTNIPTQELIYQGKTKEIFFYPVGTGTTSVVVGDYEISTSFGIGSTTTAEYNAIDLKATLQYPQIMEMLKTLVLK